MGYTKLGKSTLFKNKDATEENRQPHFRGDITVDYDIPKGAKIGLAGWLNERGPNKSLFFAISCKNEELQVSRIKPVTMDFDELKDVMEKGSEGKSLDKAVQEVQNKKDELPF
jgi:hypothetical protein